MTESPKVTRELLANHIQETAEQWEILYGGAEQDVPWNEVRRLLDPLYQLCSYEYYHPAIPLNQNASNASDTLPMLITHAKRDQDASELLAVRLERIEKTLLRLEPQPKTKQPSLPSKSRLSYADVISHPCAEAPASVKTALKKSAAKKATSETTRVIVQI
ncbi:hypothetical protein GJ744_010125 [Endocarpon pusillum]|uniref:Uncharacterized protein n=1 Tax=Endocarpon pusillum TaxID=364733 RepID=A0A8H7AGT3_9EURO|nr:hypothetical protein GJ744_010125 [Endocarpon pusillum]